MHSTTVTVPNSLNGLVFEPGAAEFCERHQLGQLLEIAVRLAARHYSLAGAIEVEIQTDPDADEENPLLVIPVLGSADTVHKQHIAYTNDWISSVTPDASLKILTFLSIRGAGE